MRSVPATRANNLEKGANKAEKVTYNRLGGMSTRSDAMGSDSDYDLSPLYDYSKSHNDGAHNNPA